VTDSGPGVSEELRARIFEPFFTTKATCGGSGMGLAMVHGIVSDHGGFVRVTDGEQGGARFEVYLPESTAEMRTGLRVFSQTSAGDEDARDPSTSDRDRGESGSDKPNSGDAGADESLEDLVAAFLSEEQSQTATRPDSHASGTPRTLRENGAQLDSASNALVARSSAPALSARTFPRRVASRAQALPAPPGERCVPAAAASAACGRTGDESVLERLVAEFMAAEGGAAASGVDNRLANDVDSSAPCSDAALVPAVRGSALATRASAIERAPEFRPGHARLLGAGRSRRLDAALPYAAARALPPAPDRARPSEPPREPLPFPYGLP
jgi:hypothetical protein